MENIKGSTTYQIRVQNQLNEKWAHWLNGMVVKIKSAEEDSNDTTIIVRVPDQPALRGILNKLWDLNLTLISVTQQENSTPNGGPDEN